MKKNILVVASHGQNNAMLLDWYDKAENFTCTIADTDERAIELAHQLNFDLVIADSTDQSIDIKKLQAVLPILNYDLELLTYRGESAASLDDKIKLIFDRKKAERLQKLLILDVEVDHPRNGLPAFSAN